MSGKDSIVVQPTGSDTTLCYCTIWSDGEHQKVGEDPMIVKTSVNRPNIYLECEELPNGNN